MKNIIYITIFILTISLLLALILSLAKSAKRTEQDEGGVVTSKDKEGFER